MKDEYDIIVIGGGPAGTTAARYAAKEGASVLLLEKDRDIGYPVRCGEAVGVDGLKYFLEPDPKWLAAEIDTFRLVSPEGVAIDITNLGTGGYILDRRLFDYELGRLAAREGATILTKAYVYDLLKEDEGIVGVKVKHLNEEKEFRAKIIIAADGVESRVGRWAGLKTHLKLRDIESSIQFTVSNVEINPTRCDFYLGENVAPGGYLWVFPKGEDSANIGLGIAGIYAKEKSARRYLDDFMEAHYPDASILTTVVGGVPCAHTLPNISSDNIMLTGDAAHMVNPVSGGGIISGMHGGRLAGTRAAEALKANDFSAKFLGKYDRDWHKFGGKNYERTYRIKMAVMKLTDDDLNRTARLLENIPVEERTLRKIFKTALLKKPGLILDVLKAFATS